MSKVVNNQFWPKKAIRRCHYLLALLLISWQGASAQCALEVNINTAYNFIVDSNIESPPGNNPESAYITAEICNTGTAPASGVFFYLGDGTTPGTFSTGFSPDGYPFVGSFNLEMAGSTSDATRFLNVLDPGECVTQYWMVTYPSLDDAGDALWGASNNPDDDYHLPYTAWAESADCGTASDSQDAILRNEITASANKIWPNGDNKVPDEYVAAMAAEGIGLGWDNDGNIPAAGECTQLEGVWYDMGVVGQGFDNDGDLVPDYNLWMQPVGDPSQFNPDCFQLVRTYGILIIKSKCCGDILLPFEDQLYFTNLPQNTGVVGLVFYEFKAIDGACIGSLTPYQEAASGSDNEKFNADYGTTIPIESAATDMVFNKNVDFGNLASLPGVLTYTLDFNNTGDANVGVPDLGMPLVVQDMVPAGTVYVPGSATAGANTCTCGGSYTVLYSDNGTDWYTAEGDVPGGATAIQYLQWWLTEPVAGTDPGPADSGQVQFQTTVPGTYPGAIVENVGGLSIGNHNTFIDDNALTFLPGTNSIGDLVWQDDGAGGGISSNGTQDGGEAGLDGVDVNLWYDLDGDGALDPNVDYLWGTETTAGGGAYDFTALPDGTWFVIPDLTDLTAAGCAGCGATTDGEYTITLTGGGQDYNDADFGFMPPLSITKTLTSSDPGYEGQPVTFDIVVSNNLVDNECVVNYGSAITSSGGASGTVTTANTTNAIGPNDGTSALLGFDGDNGDPAGAGNMWMTVEVPYTMPANCGTVTSVVGKWYFNITNTAGGTVPYTDDQLILFAIVDDGDGTLSYANDPSVQIVLGPAELNSFVSNSTGLYSDNMPQLVIDGINNGRKIWLDITTGVDGVIGTTQVGSFDDQAEIHFDAVGLQIFCDGTTVCDPSKILNPVALEDVYDSDILEFVSASTSPTAITTDGGMETITWGNVGPILPGESQTITVTFDGLEPTDLVNGDLTTNTATVTSSFLGDGTPANTGTDNATVTIENTGTISGTVWSDGDGDGWQGATGQEVGEDGIPGVEVTITGCSQPFANNGSCGGTTVTETVITDANGNYTFDGLIENYQYTVSIGTASLPGSTFTQTGDPDDDPVNGSGNGGTCGSGGANAGCDDLWDGEGAEFTMGVDTWGGESWDVTGINFGYSVPPTIYGSVVEDIDDSGTPTGVDFPLGGVNVHICAGATPSSPCTTGSPDYVTSTVTDTDGNYIFEDLTPGQTYSISTDFSSTGFEGTDDGTTFTSDGALDNTIITAVGSGDISGSHDFGIDQTGTSTIGDLLYVDVNGDGIQGTEDEGISGATVNLYVDVDGNGVYDPATDYLYDTQVTGASGDYLFSNLPPYDFVVVVDESSLPAALNLTQTADPDGAGTCLTCDGQTSITADGTSSYLEADFGYQPIGTGTIGDHVAADINGDGNPDFNIANVTVNLYADLNGDGTFVLMTSTETDADGNYLFENLPDGSYYVEVDTTDPEFPVVNDVPYVNSNDTNGDPDEIDVVISGGVATNVEGGACTNCDLDADFVYAPLMNIGDQLYWDANANGTMDWNEDGIVGATVELCPEGSTDLGAGPGNCMSVVTDATGYYQFINVLPPPPGETYTIVVDNTQPVIGSATQTGDPNADGLACDDPLLVTYGYPPCDNRDTINVPLNYGTNYSAGDFGYMPTGVIGDYVWHDTNGDGIQDDSEIGLAGITVELQDGICTPGVDCPTAVTDFDGLYTFSFIPDGTYTIVADPGAAYLPTSGAESVGATSTTVTLSGGVVTNIGGAGCTDCDLDTDFGYELAPMGVNQVSGTLCTDTNADGTCDADTNLDGVDVSIYQIIPPAPCNYTLTLYDSNQDTWTNGAHVNVSINGGADTEYAVTTNAVETQSFTIAVNHGDNIVISYDPVSTGLSIQNAYQLLDANNSVVFEDGYIVDGAAPDFVPTTHGPFTTSCGIVQTVLVSSTTTDASGNYTFTGLADGDYIVAVNTNQDALINASNGTTTTDGNATDITGGGTPDFTEGSGGNTWAITLSGGNASNVDIAFTAPEYDFGDLPASYNVLIDATGPYHENPGAGQVRLGSAWDAEINGQVSADAGLDDASNGDEDGVDLTNLGAATNANVFLPGDVVNIDVTLTGPADATVYVYGWIDFDQDGTFSGDLLVNETFTLPPALVAQTFTIPITIPADAPVDTDPALVYNLFARFRVFDTPQLVPELSYSGYASNGEVEDYLISYNPLPVELSGFEASANECAVDLKWTTASEENNMLFYVEHSTNGRDFTKIGEVAGAGNSAEAQEYSFTHEGVQRVFNYYRLMQVDFDGTYEYSEMLMVRADDCESLQLGNAILYPNPTKGEAVLEIENPVRSNASLSITDVNGKLLGQWDTVLDEGTITIPISLDSRPSGVYFLSLRMGDSEETKTFRIVKIDAR